MGFAGIIGFTGKVLILASCALGGWLLADEIRKRLSNLNHLKKAFVDIKNEISFRSSTVMEIIEKVGKSDGNSIEQILCSIADKRRSREKNMESPVGFGKDFYNAFACETGKLSFVNEDLELIKDFSEKIGNTDATGQITMIDDVLNKLDERICEAKDNSNKKGKMYLVLGVSLGVIITIMII